MWTSLVSEEEEGCQRDGGWEWVGSRGGRGGEGKGWKGRGEEGVKDRNRGDRGGIAVEDWKVEWRGGVDGYIFMDLQCVQLDVLK